MPDRDELLALAERAERTGMFMAKRAYEDELRLIPDFAVQAAAHFVNAQALRARAEMPDA
ncbi:MAG TPA: hypothetical protein VF389_11850 [Woeseiaceae bacterium]